MATQVTDVLTRIEARGYPTDINSDMIAILDSLQKQICGARRWDFLRGTTTINGVIGQTPYSLASVADLRAVDAIHAGLNNDFMNLMYMVPSEFREYEYMFRENGTPQVWSQFDDKGFRVWPAPDLLYVFTIDYIKTPPTLVNLTDFVVIPDVYTGVLEWGVIENLAHRERDWYGEFLAGQKYQEIFAQMNAELGVKQRQTSDQVVETGILQRVNWYRGPGY